MNLQVIAELLVGFGAIATPAVSGVAAYYAIKANRHIQVLNVSIDGRMENLIELSHALGVAETATKGDTGRKGDTGAQGERGVQGPTV